MPYHWHRLYKNGDTIILPDHIKIIRELSNVYNMAVNKGIQKQSVQQKQKDSKYGEIGSKYTTSSGEKAQVIF